MPSLATRDGRADLVVIDADTHFSEPHDLWTRHAPTRWRDRLPQVKTVNGERQWVIDGDTFMSPLVTASVIRANGDKVRGMAFTELQIEDVHRGSYDVKERVRLMDEMGVQAQILYPNLLGFGGQRASQMDPELRLVAAKVFNDAMAEVQEQSGDRLFPMTLIPWWDVDETVKEIERCHKMGLRGINTNSDPQNHHGLPDLGSTHWDPVWDVCASLDMPVNFHIGGSEEAMLWFGSSPWPSQDDERKLALGSAMLYFGNARIVANLIYSGVLERFPKLNFVSVESGIGWIPFMLQALDYQLTETAPSATAFMTMTPSEYFRRQMYGCFWFERAGLAGTIEQVGEDNVMWESDFPHPTCLFPGPVDYAEQALATLTEPVARKVMGGNAARLYNIPIAGHA